MIMSKPKLKISIDHVEMCDQDEQVMTFEFADFAASTILDSNPRLMASRLINLGRSIENNLKEPRDYVISPCRIDLKDHAH